MGRFQIIDHIMIYKSNEVRTHLNKYNFVNREDVQVNWVEKCLDMLHLFNLAQIVKHLDLGSDHGHTMEPLDT